MTEHDTASAVLVDRRDHVVIITINRPEARNAVNLAVTASIGEALDDADRDPAVRVAIITGAGDLSFCAGADLKAIAAGERMFPEGREQWGFAGFVRHFTSTPIIAAVNGTALGGGTELVLAADLAVAAEHATFGLPEVKRGLIAGAGGAFRLAEQLPAKIASEVLLTGDPIDAAAALRWGLVNQVVPKGTHLDAALQLAERIAVNAPLSVAASKRLSRRVFGEDREPRGDADAWAASAAEGRRVLASTDMREGVTAFAQKRPPAWTGT